MLGSGPRLQQELNQRGLHCHIFNSSSSSRRDNFRMRSPLTKWDPKQLNVNTENTKNSIAPIKEQVGVWALLVLPAQPALFSAGLPAFSSLHPQEEKRLNTYIIHVWIQCYICRISKISSLTKMSSKFLHHLTQTCWQLCVCVCVYILLSLLEYFLFLTVCSFWDEVP